MHDATRACTARSLHIEDIEVPVRTEIFLAMSVPPMTAIPVHSMCPSTPPSSTPYTFWGRSPVAMVTHTHTHAHTHTQQCNSEVRTQEVRTLLTSRAARMMAAIWDRSPHSATKVRVKAWKKTGGSSLRSQNRRLRGACDTSSPFSAALAVDRVLS